MDERREENYISWDGRSSKTRMKINLLLARVKPVALFYLPTRTRVELNSLAAFNEFCKKYRKKEADI